MSTPGEKELERELKLYKQKYEAEKIKRKEEHKQMLSLRKQSSYQKAARLRLEKSQQAVIEEKASVLFRQKVEEKVEEEIKKKYPTDACSISEVLRDMGILNS